MRATISVGQAGGFPIRLAAAHLENGDVAELIRVTKWPIIALSAAGLAGVGWMALSGIIEETRREKQSKTSLARLANVWAGPRKFLGVCQTPTFEFVVDGQRLGVPLDRIRSIESDALFVVPLPGYNIELLEGSTYTAVDPLTTSLTFNSFAGPQTVSLLRKSNPHPHLLELSGATVQEIASLRESLRRIVESQKTSVIGELGRDFDDIWRSRLGR